MAEVQTQLATLSINDTPRDCRADVEGPQSVPSPPQPTAARLRSRLALDPFSPVNQNGSFEFDRVLKSGYVQKRTQKTKTWRTVYLVLRPNTLSIYKSDKEEKLRRMISLSDLTAVTLLKDPKNKRENVFGLFSASKNYHFQAPTLKDAQEWVDLIREHARIEEEEEEWFLASPVVRQSTFLPADRVTQDQPASPKRAAISPDRLGSSSPEPLEPPIRAFTKSGARRPSQIDSSGLSGAELASHSDFSDSDLQRIPDASFESIAVQPQPTSPGKGGPALGALNASQAGGIHLENDPDRIIWQNWMWFLRSKGGVRQWKKAWAILRPRNFILYKDEAESSVLFLLYMSSIVSVIDIDPLSRTKKHCLQIITDEKSYRFCTHDEEALVHCLGAFKSLLTKRKELEAKAGTTAAVESRSPAA
ncbi:hypothetical protein VTK56DRAFT_10295 [Thermocarpiscus australiensis]